MQSSNPLIYFIQVIYVLLVNDQRLLSEVEGRRSATAQVDRPSMLAVVTYILRLLFPTHTPYEAQIPGNPHSEPNFRDNLAILRSESWNFIANF